MASNNIQISRELEQFHIRYKLSSVITMSSGFASVLFCGSGLAMLMRQRMLRQIEEKPALKKVTPPVTKKVPYLQYFGKHPERPDEYRGDNIMESPKSSWDNYQWLRDDSRSNEEVSSWIVFCLPSRRSALHCPALTAFLFPGYCSYQG